VLYSVKDKGLYIGYTSNLKARFQQHNDGENVSTKSRRPFKLIYYESYLSKRMQ
jgi:putative endonuclease